MAIASPLDSRSVMSEAIHDVLRNGDPTVGWRGDPELTMTHSNVHGWELWRHSPEDGPGQYELVARQRIPNAPLNLTELVKALAARDTHNRGVDHITEINRFLADVERKEREREERLTEQVRDAAARVTRALMPSRPFW